MKQRTSRLILHKFYQYLGPGVLLVFAMQFGSLAAGVVVGQFLGADYLSAASLALPMIIIAQLPGFALPLGLSIALGHYFSKRDFIGAKTAFNSMAVLGLLINIIFIPIGIFLTPSIATFLAGGFPQYIPILTDYIVVFFYSAPFFFLSFLFCYLLGADNHPGLSSLYFLISSVVHIILEVLFCLFLPKEHIMMWVALSLELGLLAGFVLVPFYLKSPSRLMKFGPSKLSFSSITGALKASLTSLLTLGLQFAMSLILMKCASTAFKTEGEMNTYAIMANLVAVIDLFTTSLIQMLPAIVSPLYGEKDYSGIRFIIKKVLLLSVISVGVLLLITLIYPEIYLLVFGIPLSSASGDYSLVIRVYSIAFFFYMLNRFIQVYFPSISANPPSLISTVLERGVAGIPLCVVLLLSMGVIGYSLGFALAEALSAILTIIFLFFYGKKKIGASSLILLPRTTPSSRYELSLSSIEEVEEASALIKENALKEGADERIATYLALGAEELLLNDFEYGYGKNKKGWGIDVILSKNDGSYILSVRDDGVPFDPISHREEDGPEAIFHGLPLLKKVASRLEYVRIINLNETIMEMDETPSPAK